MTTLVDTSALYALLDEDDLNHELAKAWLSGPGRDPVEPLVTHSYVVVESAGLAAQRLGPAASRTLLQALVPSLSVLFQLLNAPLSSQVCPTAPGSAAAKSAPKVKQLRKVASAPSKGGGG